MIENKSIFISSSIMYLSFEDDKKPTFATHVITVSQQYGLE